MNFNIGKISGGKKGGKGKTDSGLGMLDKKEGSFSDLLNDFTGSE